MIFSIYSTFAKSYLDPLIGQSGELLVTELVQHTFHLVASCFSEQFILIKLVERGLFLELSSYTSPICSVLFKGYVRYKTITSQNVSSEVQINNFFIS